MILICFCFQGCTKGDGCCKRCVHHRKLQHRQFLIHLSLATLVDTLHALIVYKNHLLHYVTTAIGFQYCIQKFLQGGVRLRFQEMRMSRMFTYKSKPPIPPPHYSSLFKTTIMERKNIHSINAHPSIHHLYQNIPVGF